MNYRDKLESMGIDTFDGAGQDDVLILCPFHDDQRPSCEVHTSKGMFYCFSCGAKGNFSKLYAELSGITVGEAKKHLMDDVSTNSVLEDIQKLLDSVEEVKVERFYSIKNFHEFFPTIRFTLGIKYVNSRKIDNFTAEAYDLRWGREGVMMDRVVIPVYNECGKLLTYAGRAIYDYMQPKIRKVQSGLSTLFGLYQLIKKDLTSKLPYLIVVEGEFDAMWLVQNGYNAVSTMGTASLTESQMMLLKRHAERVIWSYDGDEAGRLAQRAGVAMTERFMSTTSVYIPSGLDPNMLKPENLKKIYGGLLE